MEIYTNPQSYVLLLTHVAVEKGVDPAYIKLDHSQLYQSATSELYFGLIRSKIDYARHWRAEEKDEAVLQYFVNLANHVPSIEPWLKFPTLDQKNGFINVEENLDIAIGMLKLALSMEQKMVEMWCAKFADSMDILAQVKPKDEADRDEEHLRFMLKEFSNYKDDTFTRFNFFYDLPTGKGFEHSIFPREHGDEAPSRIDITNLIYLLESEQIVPQLFEQYRDSIPYLIVLPTNRSYD